MEIYADKGKVTDGDFLKVVAKFYKDDVKVCEEEFYLVDYTGVEKECVAEWTYWNMRVASKYDVDAVKFQIISSNDSLPHHFCMDLFMASITVVY